MFNNYGFSETFISNSGDLFVNDEITGENDPTLNGADYILGLGNKKKKAEKKIRKSEKALSDGNVKKAERKLNKAVKKGTQVSSAKRGDLAGKILSVQSNINTEKGTQESFIKEVTPKKINEPILIDPITKQDAPSDIGSGDNIPMGSSSSGGDEEVKEYPPMDEVVITNEKKSKIPVWVYALIGVAVLGIIIYVSKKKK